MKVLHVGPKNYPPAHGGTERVVFDIVSCLEGQVETYILVDFEQEETDSIKVMPNGYMNKLRFIYHFVKDNDIDVVHFHNETFIPLALLYSFVNRRILLTIHGCHFTNPKYNYFQRFSILVFDVLGAIFLPRLVFCSKVDKIKFSKWVPFRKIYFVANGVNPINKNIETSNKQDETYVYLGRISPEKNLIRLIDVAEQSKRMVHIYGAFDDRKEEFNQKVKNVLNKSSYVKWMGSVPYSDVLDVLSQYKTFIYPSLSEGLPLSVLEAASCGLNLILSDIPQHKILNFPIVKYINPLSFELNQKFIGNEGHKNKEFVLQNYSTKQMANNYFKIYKSLL